MVKLRVVCIGAGTIGRGWACAFLGEGHHVVLVDHELSALQAAEREIARTLGLLKSCGDAAAELLKSLTATTDLRSALDGADYVQESIVEDVSAKRTLFIQLDKLCAENVVVGSSTSAIAGSDFMGGLRISPRCLVVHPTNPPYLVPLVELCASPWTSEQTLAQTESLLKQMGKTPVRINRELPGYVLNRLQAAVVGEALHLIGKGFISPEDLDKVMTDGLGFRWCIAGPFLTGHLNAPAGYLDYMTRYGHLYQDLIRQLHIDYAWTKQDIAKADEMVRQSTGECAIDELQDWRDRSLRTLGPLLAQINAAKPGNRSE